MITFPQRLIEMNLNYDYVLEFAKKKHEGQFRADGVTPYICHPMLVAKLIKQYKKSKNIDAIIAAALLHDTLEDTYTSYRELIDNFGEMVASIVIELTTADYMADQVGKANYLKTRMCIMSPYAFVIKLCDRLANIMDSKNLVIEKQIKLKKETIEILDYLEKNKELTPTQKILFAKIREELNKMDFTNDLSQNS